MKYLIYIMDLLFCSFLYFIDTKCIEDQIIIHFLLSFDKPQDDVAVWKLSLFYYNICLATYIT